MTVVTKPNLCKLLCHICSKRVATKSWDTTNIHLHQNIIPQCSFPAGKQTNCRSPSSGQPSISAMLNKPTKYKQGQFKMGHTQGQSGSIKGGVGDIFLKQFFNFA